jgi:hypothetical protein
MNEAVKWCPWQTVSIIARLILHHVSCPALHWITGGFLRRQRAWYQDHLARVSLARRHRGSLAIDA